MSGLFDLLAGQFGIVNKIRSALSEGSGLAGLEELLTIKELEVPAEKINEIVNYFTNLQPTAQAYLDSLGRNELPDVNNLLPSLTNQLTNFSYTVQINGVTTGNITPHSFVTVISNRLLTRAEAAQIAFSRSVSSSEKSGLPGAVSADVLGITKNSGGVNINTAIPPQFLDPFGHGIF